MFIFLIRPPRGTRLVVAKRLERTASGGLIKSAEPVLLLALIGTGKTVGNLLALANRLAFG